MRRYHAAIALILGLPLAISAQETPPVADVAHDPRLQKPLTVTLAMTSLPAALKTISKSTGIQVEAATSMSPFKTTILVKDQPLGTVMARLADVYHAEWKLSGEIYRLSISSEWVSRESAFVRQEDQLRRKEAEASIRGLVDGTSQPYSQVLKELADSKTTSARKAELQKVASPGAYLLGSMFSHFSNSQWSSFWSGRTMALSGFLPATDTASNDAPVRNSANPGNAGPAQSTLPGRRPGRSTPTQPTGQTIRVWAAYEPFAGKLRTSESMSLSTPASASGLIAHPYPEGELAETPFGKEVLAWNRTEDVAELRKPVSGSLPAAPYFNNQRSLADALSWLHDKTGVSIVADAFRTPVQMQTQGPSISSWLGNLAQTNRAFLRIQDGFVMMRHGGFWKLRTEEIPEEAYAKIEAIPAPTLDNYATFAGDMKPEQTVPFRLTNATLTRFDPEPLRSAMPALRFYATLSSAEKKAAESGSAIPFRQLGSTSRERFIDAINDPGGKSTGQASLDPSVPAIAASLGFLTQSTTADRVIADNAPIARHAVGPAHRMFFGTNLRESVQYVVAID